MSPQFNEDNIELLFGNEAAENESIERLKQYYFKTSVFNRVSCNAALRILVGHKGIGKSALFKVAISEDTERGDLAILVKPDDIDTIATEEKKLLQLIRDWKNGLNRIIADKVFLTLGLSGNGDNPKIGKIAGQLINFLTDTVSKISSNIDLDPTKRALTDKFLKTKKIIIYLDDLDRGWEGRAFDIKRISALLNAVRDLSSENPSIYFRIALRSDVYYLVRTSDESTDKIEGSVIWYSWTNHEILVMLIKRIETFFGREIDEAVLLATKQYQLSTYLESIFERRFAGRGHWENAPIYRVLMSLIRKRPRDMVKLCTASARAAHIDKSEIILTKHLESVFEEYSQGRVQDTINEYKTEMPELSRLIFGMKPTKREKTAKESYYYTTDLLVAKLKNIEQGGKFKFADRKEATIKELAQFLYKINFIIATKQTDSGPVQRKYFEESRYLINQFADFGYAWEVHPAYRWALQPDRLDSIFLTLQLSSDE